MPDVTDELLAFVRSEAQDVNTDRVRELALAGDTDGLRKLGFTAGAAVVAATPPADLKSPVSTPLIVVWMLLGPERAEHLLRDVCGNPFRPVAFCPGWRTTAVKSLAVDIYNDRAFERLPILADAIQDAGCDDAEALGHCRTTGPHVRGCWVVDLILGKT